MDDPSAVDGMRKLFRNATVVTVDPKLGTFPRAEILVEGNSIVAVAPDLGVEDAEIIDARNLIAIPGLVDTHRHLWMTLLRGFVSDGTWSSYAIDTFWGRRLLYRPEESYIATYAGALEALDAGVTTVLDFDDSVTAPGQADAAVQGLMDAGIRSVYGYGLVAKPRLETGKPLTIDDLGCSSDWHQADATRLRNERLSADDALITFGITARNLEFLPFEETHRDLGLARALGAKRITTHAGIGALSGGAPWIESLYKSDLLADDLIFSHGQSFTARDLDLIAGSGASIAVSPESEIGQGADPVTWTALQHNVQVSLGADSVGSLSGDLFRQMQFALKAGRGTRAREFDRQGRAPIDVQLTTSQMLEIATLGGAKALGLADRVGSLTPGKRADIVFVRTDRIGMLSGAEPQQLIVSQANGGDVDTVMVDGKLIKQSGNLNDVNVTTLSSKLDASREYLSANLASTDLSAVRAVATRMLEG